MKTLAKFLNNSTSTYLQVVIILTMSFSTANAADLNWSGLYRIEGVSLYNTRLNDDGLDKQYLLHHMVLAPKITAADGIAVYARLDLLNADSNANNQMGDYFGQPETSTNPGNKTTTATGANQKAQAVLLTQAYLKWSTEYGQLIAGRAPLHFGLGTYLNSGIGAFDHFYDTRDVLGYRMLAGNLSIFPMFTKQREGNLEDEDDFNSYMVQVMYENPDTELNLGVLYEMQVATVSGNDAPFAGNQFGGAGSSRDGNWDMKNVSVFAGRRYGAFQFAVEADFTNGRTGIKNAQGNRVNWDAYAIVSEFGYELSPKWGVDLKLGTATGDDPGTTDRYEGYLVDRNYEIAFLLFNHKLGMYDAIGTDPIRNGSGDNVADFETLTNANWVAPSLRWQFDESWQLINRWVWAQIQKGQIANLEIGKSLGVEWDILMNYKPNKNLTVEGGAGLLFPGDAFKAGPVNYPTQFGFGIITRAAVSF